MEAIETAEVAQPLNNCQDATMDNGEAQRAKRCAVFYYTNYNTLHLLWNPSGER